MLVGLFFLEQYVAWRKERERELSTFDENRRAVGVLNPMHDNNEDTHLGGEATKSMTTVYPQDRRE